MERITINEKGRENIILVGTELYKEMENHFENMAKDYKESLASKLDKHQDAVYENNLLNLLAREPKQNIVIYAWYPTSK